MRDGLPGREKELLARIAELRKETGDPALHA
jgi:hypothetical protein